MEYGKRSFVVLLASVVVVVVTVEGPVVADIVFGSYTFTDACPLGPKWLPNDRPLFVPVAWFVSAYPAYIQASYLIPQSSTKLARRAIIVLVASMLTAFSNVVSDPIMVSVGSAGWVGPEFAPEWVWHYPPGTWTFEGVPIRNNIGWLLSSLIFFSVWALVDPSVGWAPIRSPAPLFVSLCMSLFYVVHRTTPMSVRVAALGLLGFPTFLALCSWMLMERNKRH